MSRRTAEAKCVRLGLSACSGAFVISLMLAPQNLGSQSVQGATEPHTVSCVDTISTPGVLPRIVYIKATLAVGDSADPRIRTVSDLYAQSVAQRLRLMFHPRGDTLPAADPVITWRAIDWHTSVAVTIRRNAAANFQLLSPPEDPVAGTMLLSAARTAVDSGEGPFWPESIPGDSLTFIFAYEIFWNPKVQRADTEPLKFPVFYLMYPSESQATQVSRSSPRYPEDLQSQGVSGTVILDFRIDPSGHYVPRSASEVWRQGQKRLTGQTLAMYNEFLQAVLDWLPGAEFTPARIGNCPVTQIVEEPFIFSISH